MEEKIITGPLHPTRFRALTATRTSETPSPQPLPGEVACKSVVHHQLPDANVRRETVLAVFASLWSIRSQATRYFLDTSEVRCRRTAEGVGL
jgi:hypothetical protein